MVFDDSELREYYSRRAQEFDSIYHRDDPVRQAEQAQIADATRESFADRRVLEVASGTGFWTAYLAEVARQVIAIDSSTEMIEIARQRKLVREVVEYRKMDAYQLDLLDETFDGGVVNFWISHVPKSGLNKFLKGFHSKLEPGSSVLAVDSVYIPEFSGELVRKENEPDTYVNRRLSDDSRHLVLKNYYNADDLEDIFSHWADDLCIKIGDCFWIVQYRTKHV
ncbi:MAG: class I SAM-dependent methyltransferase [Candidatus Zixiibacteriota bacterium]